MKTTSLVRSTVLTVALMAAAAGSGAQAAESMELDGSELDMVTAGAVAVSSDFSSAGGTSGIGGLFGIGGIGGIGGPLGVGGGSFGFLGLFLFGGEVSVSSSSSTTSQ